MAWNWTAQSCCRAQWNEARQDIAYHITLAHAKHTIVSVKSGVLCQPHGFSLHADVRCAMHQRSKLERLCRYITRPAIADERLASNQDGQVILTLKTPFRDGTTPIMMSPLEFMQRLAALVSRARLNLIRFHGVLAPNAKLRSEISLAARKTKITHPIGMTMCPLPWLLCASVGRVCSSECSISSIVRIAAEP